MTKITNSALQTQEFANEFIVQYLKSNIVALIGDLGSGKTTFVQGLGQSLGIQESITSPTYLLLKQYTVKNHPKIKKLIHVDLYRINSWEEIAELDLEELWRDPTNLVVIEWGERIEKYLPENTQRVVFKHLSENKREIIVDENKRKTQSV